MKSVDLIFVPLIGIRTKKLNDICEINIIVCIWQSFVSQSISKQVIDRAARFSVTLKHFIHNFQALKQP